MLTKKWVLVKRKKQSSARSSCLCNLPLPIEDIQARVMVSSEEEQLVGHELFKTRSNLKVALVPPLFSSNIEAMIVHPEDNQSLYRQRKVQTKPKKTSFKMAKYGLTKKWIVVKKNQQLHDIIEMAILLKVLVMHL
jgi:hypothetical protein